MNKKKIIDAVTILPIFLPPDLSFCFLCNQAIHGQAIERHILGLKMVAIEDLTSLPEIFMDTSFAVSSHFNLFTSQVCGCLITICTQSFAIYGN